MKLAVFFGHFPLEIVTVVYTFVNGLAERGFSIDLFLFETGPVIPQFRPGVTTVQLPSALSCRPGQRNCYHDFVPPAAAQLIRTQAACRQYDYCIGIESAGMLLADVAATEIGAPLGYQSLELYREGEPGIWTNQEAVALRGLLAPIVAKLDLFMIQDRFREEVFFQDFDRWTRPATLYMPVAMPAVTFKAKPSYWHELFALPSSTRVVLYFGQLVKNRFVDRMIQAAQKFPGDLALVVHGPPSGEVEELQQLDKNRRVFFSVRVVPNDLIPTLVASADLGLVFYRNDKVNDYLTGMSSTKMAAYMQCGIPVVCSDYPTFRLVTERYHCGIGIDDYEQLPLAVNAIFSDYRTFSRGAQAAFREVYNLDPHLDRLAAHIRSRAAEAAPQHETAVPASAPGKARWEQVAARSPVRLYAGDVHDLPEYLGWTGLSLTQENDRHMRQDMTEPLPFPDNSVDAFQSEDVFEHIAYDRLIPVLNELHRVLKPGALFRLSVPDYRCDVLYNRSVKDAHGNLLFDPIGGGTPENPGHVWFPRYENVRSLLEASRFGSDGTITFLHYYEPGGKGITRAIDYSKGHVQRTPDFDPRVQTPYRPMSLVVDLTKASAPSKPQAPGTACLPMHQVSAAVQEVLASFPLEPCILALETGTVCSYQQQSESTRHISQVLGNRGKLISVDLSPESIRISRDVCKNAPNIEWVLSDSLAYLKKAAGQEFHFALLDSANDADLAFSEFALVATLMRNNGILMINDAGVRPDKRGFDGTESRKGHRVWQFLLACDVDYEIMEISSGRGTRMKITFFPKNAQIIKAGLLRMEP